MKRGGRLKRQPLHEYARTMEQRDITEILALHEGLKQLERTSERTAHVVSLRFFAGLDHSDIAELLGISEATVRREWAFAKTLLYRRLTTQEDF